MKQLLLCVKLCIKVSERIYTFIFFLTTLLDRMMAISFYLTYVSKRVICGRYHCKF